MNISAKDVKRLRDTTGAGMMDCKKALIEANGDFDAAIDILRKKGQKVSAKRADRETKEGVIAVASSEDGTTTAIVEVNCETDFVARNEEFVAFANALAALALNERPTDLDGLKALSHNGASVADAVTNLTGKIGEKIDVRRFDVVQLADGKAVSYIHPGAKLGVVVKISGTGDLQLAGTDTAMQVAAMNPIATNRNDVPETVKEKEMAIAREVAINEGKPEQIVDRIAQGKLERYYKDNVLLEQAFVKDSSMSVKDMLKKADADVTGFVRYAIGG